MEVNKEDIKNHFERFPHMDVVFASEDRRFHTEGAAISSVGAGNYMKLTRKEVMSFDADAEAEAKTKAIEFIVATDAISTIDYQTQLKTAKTLGIELADKKAETVMAALVAYKETLKGE